MTQADTQSPIWSQEEFIDSLAREMTSRRLASLVARRSQIPLGEAHALLSHVLRTYFGVGDPALDQDSPLNNMLDVRRLMVKLSYSGLT